MADGLQDLTGGIPSSVDLDEAGREPGMLWKLLVSNHKAGYMMGAGTPQGSDRDVIQVHVLADCKSNLNFLHQ